MPVSKMRQQQDHSRKSENLAIFRDQLAELEREKAEGTLLEADFQQARTELQRRLLEDVDSNEALLPTSGKSRPTSNSRHTQGIDNHRCIIDRQRCLGLRTQTERRVTAIELAYKTALLAPLASRDFMPPGTFGNNKVPR